MFVSKALHCAWFGGDAPKPEAMGAAAGKVTGSVDDGILLMPAWYRRTQVGCVWTGCSGIWGCLFWGG